MARSTGPQRSQTRAVVTALLALTLGSALVPPVAATIVCTHDAETFEALGGAWQKDYACDRPYDTVQVTADNGALIADHGATAPGGKAEFTACLLDPIGRPTRCVTECGIFLFSRVPQGADVRITLEAPGRLGCATAAGYVSVVFADV